MEFLSNHEILVLLHSQHMILWRYSVTSYIFRLASYSKQRGSFHFKLCLNLRKMYLRSFKQCIKI